MDSETLENLFLTLPDQDDRYGKDLFRPTTSTRTQNGFSFAPVTYFCRVCRETVRSIPTEDAFARASIHSRPIGNPNLSDVEAHCRLPAHNEKVAGLRQIQRTIKDCFRMAIDTRAKTRVQRLGSKTSQDAVYAIFARHLFRTIHDFNAAHITVRIGRLLAHYELIEATTMLELALWKAACLLDMPPSAMMGYLELLAWHSGGWKAKKQELRHSSTISVVISRVLPFLVRHQVSRHAVIEVG